jgi:hypothetical protein
MAGGGNGGEMSGMGPFGRWLDWSQGWIVHDGGFSQFVQTWQMPVNGPVTPRVKGAVPRHKFGHHPAPSNLMETAGL